ncbi:MAG: insulinase family protein [Anaerolineae bacterium]|nr:insulinase family protein [Anaerolineae bacterium]
MMAYGFEMIRDPMIPELNSRARIWHHIQTGAELLSIENDDSNKAFGIMFRTPPPDASGLPHVLEHSVLGGSRKYPVRSPLDEVLKGSLVTYVNALTFPDKTGYIVASQNVVDLYNVADVFLDAVFYPLLTRQTFKREGWHYELESFDNPLILNGIVLNEQRGNFSSPARLIEHHSQMPLFPDIPYGVSRAGEPSDIPNLTYERLMAYHHTYYHPSNARLFFYGDDDPEERLHYLDTWLRDFQRVEVDSAFPLQPRFDRPRRVIIPYDAGQDTGETKGIVTINWVLDEVGDPETMLALEVLAHLLVGMPASPLRAALIDSELGQDLAGIGLFTHVRQMYFSTGLQGICPDNVSQIEALIEETLSRLSDEGIDPAIVAASLNAVGFRLREANYGPFPRGFALFWHRISTTWIHDGDPLALLAFEAPLQAIADRLEKGERYFEHLIRMYLVDNTHRATVALVPDPAAHFGADERKRLDELRAAMNESDLRALIAETKAFRLAQETPDLPEALAQIPGLALSDLDTQNPRIPCQALQMADCTVLYHDLSTHGILYLDLAFDLSVLPQELLPYAPLLGQVLIGMGTDGEDYAVLSQNIGRTTGGISSSLLISAGLGSRQSVGRLVLRGKATVSRADDLFGILSDILLTARFDNQKRFAQLVLEAIARLESGLLPNGTEVVGRRLGARYSEAGWLAEQVSGIEQLAFLHRLAEEIRHDWPIVFSRLEEVRRRLICRRALVCNVTLDGANWPSLTSRLDEVISSLPVGPVGTVDWKLDFLPAFEGLSVPSRVNYVAKGASLYDLGYKLHGSIAAITHYIEMAWLQRRVRIQGGAYGAFCAFDRPSGFFTYLSYRDPNLLGTIKTYDQTAHFLRDLELSENELAKSIIGAVGRLDAYRLPDARGYTSMVYYLCGESDEDRQRLRDELLTTTVADFRAFVDVLQNVQETGGVVVMGSPEAIAEANACDGHFEITKVL